MIASTNNWKDIRKYFENTFIVCPEYNPKAALYVNAVTDTGLKVTDGETKGFIDFAEAPYEILSPLVNRRMWFQHGNFARLVQRIPARMWRKGISSENTVTKGFSSAGEILYEGGLNQERINSLLNFIPPTVLNATGKSSIALNDKWCLHVKTETLYVYHCPVGKLSIKRNKVSLLKEFGMLDLPPSLKHMDVQYV